MALSDRPYGPNTKAALVASQIPLNQQSTGGQTKAGVLSANFDLVAAAQMIAPSAPNPAVPLSVAIGPDTQIEQTVFDLFASGYIQTRANGTVTIDVYEGDDETIANNTLLGTSGAITQNTGIAAWWAHLQLIFDSVSGVLAGTAEFYVNRTVVARATFLNFPGGFLNQGDPSANPPTASKLPTFSLTFASTGATPATPTTVNVQKFSVG